MSKLILLPNGDYLRSDLIQEISLEPAHGANKSVSVGRWDDSVCLQVYAGPDADAVAAEIAKSVQEAEA